MKFKVISSFFILNLLYSIWISFSHFHNEKITLKNSAWKIESHFHGENCLNKEKNCLLIDNFKKSFSFLVTKNYNYKPQELNNLTLSLNLIIHDLVDIPANKSRAPPIRKYLNS